MEYGLLIKETSIIVKHNVNLEINTGLLNWELWCVEAEEWMNKENAVLGLIRKCHKFSLAFKYIAPSSLPISQPSRQL